MVTAFVSLKKPKSVFCKLSLYLKKLHTIKGEGVPRLSGVTTWSDVAGWQRWAYATLVRILELRLRNLKIGLTLFHNSQPDLDFLISWDPRLLAFFGFGSQRIRFRLEVVYLQEVSHEN
jgi:hypothetical protein